MMTNFVIVMLFNAIWLLRGTKHFIDLYTGGYSKWLTVAVIVYDIWGIICLIISLEKYL